MHRKKNRKNENNSIQQKSFRIKSYWIRSDPDIFISIKQINTDQIKVIHTDIILSSRLTIIKTWTFCTHKRTIPLSLSHTHTLFLSHTHIHYLSLSHTHIHYLSLSLTYAQLHDWHLFCMFLGNENFHHGIEIITIADYFSLGNRIHSYLTIAPTVAFFDQKLHIALSNHLLTVKLAHWDVDIRYVHTYLHSNSTQSQDFRLFCCFVIFNLWLFPYHLLSFFILSFFLLFFFFYFFLGF